MPDLRLRKRHCASRVRASIVAKLADRDDPGQARAHLVQCDAVCMRVKPERTEGVIRRNIDVIVSKTCTDVPVIVGCIR